jgi:very-short-patch-repair endonuclease
MSGFPFACSVTPSSGMRLGQFDFFATDHHGLVSFERAQRAGVSRSDWYRSLRRGDIEYVHPGVARLVGSPYTREQRIAAAVLAAGHGAMASHRSAAHLFGVPRPDDDPVDIILVERRRRPVIAGAIVHRPRDLKDLSPVLRCNIPCCNILRWCCDLGAVDEPGVNPAVGHVVAGGLASPWALRTAIDVHARRGRHGVPAFRAALDDWVLDGKPVDSILEPKMRKVLKRFGLPPAQFHSWIAGYEVDFHFHGTPVVLECDGWETHGLNRARFERDRDRNAAVTAAGFVIVHFTYRQLCRQPERVANKIRANLSRWAPHLLD